MTTTIDNQADHKRDGDLCTAKFVTTGSGSATTAATVVGQIVQIGVNRTAGTGSFTLTLSDDTNSMTLWSDSIVGTDIMPNYINNALGAECRGNLKCNPALLIGSGTWELTIYYIKV